jgi:hypothetical protein
VAISAEEFFAGLNRLGFVPALATTRQRVRLDVSDGLCTQHWMVAIEDGRVRVTRERDDDVNGVLQLERTLLDEVVRGRTNLMAARLRGEVGIVGTLEPIAMFGWLVPQWPSDGGAPGSDKERAG